jgi:hypothetical protein
VRRLGLRASIALTIAAVTLTATAVMALVPYQLQAGAARDRFSAAALAGFESRCPTSATARFGRAGARRRFQG